MRIRLRSVPDQYYTFTARLAAAGHQRASMRMIALCILSLGVPAAVAAAFPRSTTLPGGRAVLALVAVACVGLATPWFQHRWPTRTESAVVVVAGSVALAAGSVIPADPMAGLLVAVAFAFVLGYTALFHSVRLMTFTVIAAGATTLWLAARITVRDDLATAVSVVTPTVLLCSVVSYGCRTIAEVSGSARSPAEIDPVTGLLTRDSFYEKVATLLGARHRGDDRYLVVIAAAIDGLSAIAGIHGARGMTRAQVDAGLAISDTARSGAIIAHPGDAVFLVADTFTTADPTPLAERILGSIAATPTGMTASAGVVSTPLRPLTERPPYDVIDEVIALAEAAMAQARAAGGNQARYVLDPRLSGDGVTEDAEG